MRIKNEIGTDLEIRGGGIQGTVKNGETRAFSLPSGSHRIVVTQNPDYKLSCLGVTDASEITLSVSPRGAAEEGGGES